jgi:hypothetical protein
VKNVLEEAWVLYSLEWRLVEGSVVSSWQIRDTVFRLSAKWVMILEKSKLKRGKIHHMMVYL